MLINPELTDRILSEVRNERERQDIKWGRQTHDLPFWMVILGEEFGEACSASFEGAAYSVEYTSSDGLREIAEELTQVAAVAVVIVENIREELDRREGWQQQ